MQRALLMDEESEEYDRDFLRLLAVSQYSPGLLCPSPWGELPPRPQSETPGGKIEALGAGFGGDHQRKTRKFTQSMAAPQILPIDGGATGVNLMF